MRHALLRMFGFAVVSASAVTLGQTQAPRTSPGVGSPAAPNAPRAAPPAQANAPAQAAAPVPQPNDARMHQLLKDWEQRSSRLKTLDVQITRSDKSEAWGNEFFEGRAILQSPNLAWLNFDKIDKTDPKKPVRVPEERIICTGTEVWQYKNATRQVFIFTLDRQNQKRALEEGPLPFLFNMKADEAEQRYNMTLISVTAEHFIISVVPKLQIDMESFSRAYLKLNRQTYLPDRIMLFSPNGKDTKDFVLSNVKPNAAVAPANFKGVPMGKPWTMVKDPGENGAPRAQAQPAPIGSRPAPAPVNRRR